MPPKDDVRVPVKVQGARECKSWKYFTLSVLNVGDSSAASHIKVQRGYEAHQEGFKFHLYQSEGGSELKHCFFLRL